MRFLHSLAITGLALGAGLHNPAQASVMLNFYSSSTYTANTAAMNAALGISQATIDSFESPALTPGLSITLSGGVGVTTTTWTSLPNLFNGNNCDTTLANQAWDGVNEVSNLVGNACTQGGAIASSTTFNYAPGTTLFGIGLSNFQSLNSPLFPLTNHELFVNGVDMGVLETLAGVNWTPGVTRNAYLVVTATGVTQITSVGFENISSVSGADYLLFDHLAISTPEPASIPVLGLGLASLAFLRLRTSKNRNKPANADSRAD